MKLPGNKNLLLLIAILVVLVIFVMYIKIFRKMEGLQTTTPAANLSTSVKLSTTPTIISSTPTPAIISYTPTAKTQTINSSTPSIVTPDVNALLTRISTLENKIVDLRTIIDNTTTNYSRKSDITNALTDYVKASELPKIISAAGTVKVSDINDLKTALANLMRTYDTKFKNYYTKTEIDRLKKK